MLQNGRSWAVLALGVVMLTASLIPACGGSGGAGASPQGGNPPASAVTFSNALSGMSATHVQAALDELDARLDALNFSSTRVHESSTSGVTVIPENQPVFIIRTIVFTPSNPSDRILSITAEGTYDVVGLGSSPTDLYLAVRDAAGKAICDGPAALVGSQASSQRLNLLGTGLPFRVFTRMTARTPSASAGQDGAYPSTSYSIDLRAASLPTFLGQITSLRFRIVTTEGVTVVAASPNISG